MWWERNLTAQSDTEISLWSKAWKSVGSGISRLKTLQPKLRLRFGLAQGYENSVSNRGMLFFNAYFTILLLSYPYLWTILREIERYYIEVNIIL